jgi:(S)-ureidoglycine aminohydrolase
VVALASKSTGTHKTRASNWLAWYFRAMQNLGFTRSSVKLDHALLTPDSFIRAPLPGFVGATCVVHVASALGAQFTQYTVEAQPGGVFGPPPIETSRFVFVLEGEFVLTVGKKSRVLKRKGYAYIPPNLEHSITAKGVAKAMVIEKLYEHLGGDEPELIVGDSTKVVNGPVLGDPSVQVGVLIPDEPRYDMQVNTMTFDPGASLSLVEIHVMEHGLTMLEGGGIYRLGDNWYPVQSGDVIYMAPYCPQWFGALGKSRSQYLIYKDWNRHPLE